MQYEINSTPHRPMFMSILRGAIHSMQVPWMKDRTENTSPRWHTASTGGKIWNRTREKGGEWVQGEAGRGGAVQGEGGWGGVSVGNGRQDGEGGWWKMRGRRTAGTPCTLFPNPVD